MSESPSPQNNPIKPYVCTCTRDGRTASSFAAMAARILAAMIGSWNCQRRCTLLDGWLLGVLTSHHPPPTDPPHIGPHPKNQKHAHGAEPLGRLVLLEHPPAEGQPVRLEPRALADAVPELHDAEDEERREPEGQVEGLPVAAKQLSWMSVWILWCGVWDDEIWVAHPSAVSPTPAIERTQQSGPKPQQSRQGTRMALVVSLRRAMSPSWRSVRSLTTV